MPIPVPFSRITAEAEIRRLDALVATQGTTITTLASEKAVVVGQLGDANAALSVANDTITTHVATIATLTASVSTLTVERDTANDAVAALTADLVTRTAERDTLTAQLAPQAAKVALANAVDEHAKSPTLATLNAAYFAAFPAVP